MQVLFFENQRKELLFPHRKQFSCHDQKTVTL